MRGAALVVVVAALSTACPPPVVDPPPAPRQPLRVTASVATDAPAADAADAPVVILPSGVPDDVTVIDLGLLGVANGHTGDITVDVTSGLGAMTVLVYGQQDATVILERAEDPDGAAVVNDEEPPGLDAAHLAFARGFPAQVYSVNRVLGSTTSGAFLLPNTPEVAPLSGKWKLRVGQYAVQVQASPPRRAPVDRPVHVVLLVKGQDTGHGVLDLNLHFTGGITAATAPDDALVQGALDVVRTTYAAAGVDIGEVRLKDIDPAFATVTLAEGRCEAGDLDRIVAEGAGDDRGVDLFFVDGFVCIVQTNVDVGTAIGGIAAGIPGMALVHGSSHSGVVVSTSFAGGDPQPLGVVMAHEMGHFLGLYHTKESNVFGANPVVDEIADTPEDDGSRDNLMYFAADEATSLTAEQGQVLRSSPFVVATDN